MVITSSWISQLGLVYLCSGLSKLQPNPLQSLHAVTYFKPLLLYALEVFPHALGDVNLLLQRIIL